MNQATAVQRVMFVDDSRLMRYAGSKFLASHCEVVLAENGREAWQHINTDAGIQVIFTDLMMPVMDGHELIQLIRASDDHRVRQLPVLVVSSKEESGARDLAVKEGATDFIPKPFSPEDLRHALQYKRIHNEIPIPATESTTPLESDSVEKGEDPSGEPATYLHRLEQTLSFHHRQQLDLALLHLQFQGYWHIANRFGQSWADAVMRNLNRALVDMLRHEDSIHQTGPDLFSIILMGTDRRGARFLSNRLRQRLSGAVMRFASMKMRVVLRFAIQFPDVYGEEDPAQLFESALRLINWRTAQQPRVRPAAAAIASSR